MSANNTLEISERINKAIRKNSTDLDLHGMNLREQPVAIKDLSQLRHLTQLQSLDLSYNKLIMLPNGLRHLTLLQSLNLSQNQLKSTDGRRHFTQLQFLELNNNGLLKLPDWLRHLTQLKTLDLSQNQLASLDELSQLAQLQSLNLSQNRLYAHPVRQPSFTKLAQLQSLNISQNRLHVLPNWLRHLTKLKNLNLSGNRLTQLPDWLREHTQLQSLDLSHNQLTQLPDWLCEHTQLESLALSYNLLTQLPDWLHQLTKLNTLYCYNNPITDPPPEILGDALKHSFSTVNLEALHRYFNQLLQARTVTFYEAKLLIIGEGGAGKTSLTCKLQDKHAPLPKKEESTDGIDIVTWHFPLPPECDEEQYRVNIWDFGGQEVYFATHQFFLTRRSVYVLVADTRQQHTDFYTWLRMQETFGGDSPIILLKNRNRRHGSRFFIENLPELRKRFANLKDVIELDLENVPDADNWPTLLRNLEYRFLTLDHVGKPRPATWVAVREALSQDSRDTITQQQYLNVCTEHYIKRTDNALQLSDYLHHLGDILHFQKDAVLGDLVILQPTWGLDAVYRVLDSETIVKNWGQFTRSELHTLWHEPKYDGHHHHLLRLMENFQLCYPLTNQPDTFIAPQLLEPEVPDYTWDHEDNRQLRYHYPDFMPRGILSRAIVKLHDRIENQDLVWRSGVILNNGYARAELLELRGENEIRIRISGQNKRDLLMEVVKALDELHLGFPKLRYEKRIPCNCTACAPRLEPHFFNLKDLLDRLAHRRDTIECNNPPYNYVAIHGLIGDDIRHMQKHPGNPFDQRNIYNVFGSLYQGDHHQGDKTEVGDITDSTSVAIGRKSSADTN
ncbi:MAG: GTPase [Chloroflexi bacterium]|nr:MAG: GTPase [Chloroflexota bacterium]